MSLDELRYQQERRARLLNLTLTCMVVLAFIVLGACGPSDVDIARSGVPVTEPKVVAMTAVPAERLVLPTTTVPPTTAAPTTSALPLQEVAEPPALRDVTPVAPVDHSNIWDRLAQCESNGNWAINTGNGYYGGLQFSLSSWRSVGGTGYPHEHSRETQIEMGKRLQAVQGWGAWPACSRKLGLR